MDAAAAQTPEGLEVHPAPAVLELAGVHKRWAGAERPVLDDMDLTLPAGQVVGITGRNGAGKTTLLRVAAGLIAPEAGTVSVLGLDLEEDRRACQRRLGFLTAGNSGLYGRLQVDHHLDFWSRLAMVPRTERAHRVRDARERFELGELGGRRVDRLSMGQRQRLRIALAFLHGPRLVLLDEPRTSLDDESTMLLAAAVAALAASGGAAVVCAPTREQTGVALDRCLTVVHGRLDET